MWIIICGSLGCRKWKRENGNWCALAQLSRQAAKVALTGLGGFEAEAGVVGGPFAVGVAELGAEGILDFGEVGVAFLWREFVGEIVAEGLEPGGYVAG